MNKKSKSGLRRPKQASSKTQAVSVRLGLDESDDEAALRHRLARELRVSEEKLPEFAVRRRSIDARRDRVQIEILVEIGGDSNRALGTPFPIEVKKAPSAIIVGAGPAGLFCAYELARYGIASMVVDRGKLVQPRRRDLKALNLRGIVNEDSNYCFGEGGAGTYSDGKLYTRSQKRGDVRDVLETLAVHGAPQGILVDARPHVGSNKLPKVVTAIRERLESAGVVFRFESKVVGLLIEEKKSRRVRGVKLATGEELEGDAVVIATGHSAEDIYSMLASHGVGLEAKPFALGVRIEHPQPLINSIQYGQCANHPKLPAAYYRLASTVESRGVFSFCMCPGGFIVPAATHPEGLVVNGMSLSKRNSPFANSGLVVAVDPKDLEKLGFEAPMGGIAFQRKIEAAAFKAGGGELSAPATRVTDFLKGAASTTVPASSYVPGLTPQNIADVVDATGLKLSSYLRAALVSFGKSMRGYITEEAVLVGVESRTSSPVRIPRVPTSLESPDLLGLYPCAEGAGYAGGIVSAALDGMRVAKEIARGFKAIR